MWYYGYDNCQCFHDGSNHWTFPIHITFGDLNCISNSQCVNWEFYDFIRLSWNDCWFCQIDHEYTKILISHMLKGHNWHIFALKKKEEKKASNVVIFLGNVISRSLKVCMLITLFGMYIFIVGLMSLTLFQSHSYVRTLNYKWCFWDSCLDSCVL